MDHGWGLRTFIKNNGEVTTRVEMRFCNVLQDNAAIASDFDWTNPAHRRVIGGDYANVFLPTSATAPRIRVYSGTHTYNTTSPGPAGIVLQPQEEAELVWTITGDFYKTGTTTQTTDLVDRTGDFSGDRAFRLNYDIFAKQVD